MSYLIKWKCTGCPCSFIEKHNLEQSRTAKIKCESAFSALSHMALPKTHPLWEHWRLVAPWGRLSANLFCAVNNDERAWALFSSTVQAVTVRSTRSLANVWRGTVIGSRPSQHTKQNTSVETEWKRVSGEGLGRAFLSLGHNSLPCKQRKSCRPIAGCSTWAKPELQKRDLAAHIKAS